MAQSLLFKSWSKKSNTMSSCRVWVKELGLNKFKWFVAWVKEIHEQEQMPLCRKIPKNDRAKNLINGYSSVQ